MSYATKDSERFEIKEFAKKLEEFHGIDKVLIWEEDTKDNIIHYMNNNLEQCDLLLLICTKNSKNSKPVNLEWRATLVADKRIIPIFDEIENVPFIIRPMMGLKCSQNLVTEVYNIHQLIMKDNNLSGRKDSQYDKTGYCIRCKKEIPFNPKRPYCYYCFQTWAVYDNPEYTERYCHECGVDYAPTINYPLCNDCC